MVESLREVTTKTKLTSEEVIALATPEKGYSDLHVNALFQYAHRLESANLPVIFDYEHLSRQSRFKSNFLFAVANSPDRFYRTFRIKKRTGGIRTINEPLPDLKILQRWMLDNIVTMLPLSKYAHAYRVGKSIKTSAKLHINRKILIKVDLEDFFGSITVDKITDIFKSAGYSDPLSVLLSQLCCLDGCLPQGAPTSAALSNAVMTSFDDCVGSWSLLNNWRYTRYADDLAFSGDGDVDELFRKVLDQINLLGMRVNQSKTRVMRPGSRQIVCGVVVNDKMGPTKQSVRLFQQEVFYIKKFGLESHVERRDISKRNYLDSLIGRGKHLLWLSAHRPDRCEIIKSAVDDLEALKAERIGATVKHP